jgi:hypothetical protein
MSTPSHLLPSIVTEAVTFIGIDYHKKYSVYHAVDAAGSDLGKASASLEVSKRQLLDKRQLFFDIRSDDTVTLAWRFE